MELSIESRCQIVTWKVRDFFQLPSEIGYFLVSPEFRFADDSYCLRLYPKGGLKYLETWVELELVRLTFTFPERSALVRYGCRSRKETGEEIDQYDTLEVIKQRSFFHKRNILLTCGTFIALCSMCLKEQSRARNLQFDEVETSDSEDNQNRLLGQSVLFSSRWCSSKMELSTVSPCQHVTWKIPYFFQLLPEFDYLHSPEFLFAGDRYCFRFYPKGERNGAEWDAADTVLQLVRLTSTFPERNLLYKVGYKSGIFDNYHYSDTLIDEEVFCFSLSEHEEMKDRRVEVVCFMQLKEQDSAGIPQSEEAGNSRSEEKQERLPGKIDSSVPDSVPCAIETKLPSSVIDKENSKNEDWPSLDTKDSELLSECMKELLIKGGGHDVKICVQGKEFRAHRNILSARSPVFAMMFSHDTKENISTISIEDCEPESFGEFLLYVYSGRTENLTPSNASQLCYIADKYDFLVLKERCMSLIQTSLSVESVCDNFLLAA